MLLTLPQVQQLAPREPWRLVGTTDNTDGTGINSVCQATRFADPRGKGTLVRTFTTTSAPRTRRSMVQTVEISRSPEASAQRRTGPRSAGSPAAARRGSSCSTPTGCSGLGEEAQMLKLRIPNAVRRTYVVGLARTGSLTVSTVSETLGGSPVAVDRAVNTLTDGGAQRVRLRPVGTVPDRRRPPRRCCRRPPARPRAPSRPPTSR